MSIYRRRRFRRDARQETLLALSNVPTQQMPIVPTDSAPVAETHQMLDLTEAVQQLIGGHYDPLDRSV